MTSETWQINVNWGLPDSNYVSGSV